MGPESVATSPCRLFAECVDGAMKDTCLDLQSSTHETSCCTAASVAQTVMGDGFCHFSCDSWINTAAVRLRTSRCLAMSASALRSRLSSSRSLTAPSPSGAPRSGASWRIPGSESRDATTLARAPDREPLWSPRGALTTLATGPIGMRPAKPPGPACGRPSRPAAASAVAASRIAGDDAEVPHDGGTDNPPTGTARPRLAAAGPPAAGRYESTSAGPCDAGEVTEAADAGAAREFTNGFQAAATGGARVNNEPEASKFNPSERIWGPTVRPLSELNSWTGSLFSRSRSGFELNIEPEESPCSRLGTPDSVDWALEPLAAAGACIDAPP